MDVVNMRSKYDYVLSQKDLKSMSTSMVMGPNEEGVRSVLKIPARSKPNREGEMSAPPQKS